MKPGPTGPIRVLCADPPWMMRDKLPGTGRGAARNYQCVPTRDLMRFPLPEIADDAILFLWRLASMPQEALDVAKAWGFTPKTEVIWRKVTKRGARWFGMGRTLRAEHETALVATRGRPEILCKSIRSTFDAPVPCDPETGAYIHSAKPEIFYTDIVMPLTAGPYHEMFARRRRAGWSSDGNQLPSK